LSLDDFVQGKGSKDSFCYWVERKTEPLGQIRGSPASKFGVFFDKQTRRYKFTRRFKDENIAIAFLREQLTKLLEAASLNDLEAIRKIKISEMFKGKILFLYYPNRFLNVFSGRYVDHFLREADLAMPNDDLDVLAKKDLLLAFKASDAVMSKWTTYEFNRFLYETWPPPFKAARVPLELRKYVEAHHFPSAQHVRSEFISFDLGNTTDSPRQEGQKGRHGEIDFEEQNRWNKRVGDQGEDVVYWAERTWLEENERQDLVANVTRVCRKDASAGYDIGSFELDETPKYVEVKATANKPPAQGGSVRFHLSARELEQAQKLPNYYLFIVFDAKSVNPKIWRIRDPAKMAPSLLRLQPSAYHARMVANPPTGIDSITKQAMRGQPVNKPIRATQLRSSLLPIIKQVQRGARFTVFYRSLPAFQIIPLDSGKILKGTSPHKDSLYGAVPLVMSSRRFRALHHDEVLYPALKRTPRRPT